MESRFALVLHSSLLVIGVLAAASSSLEATNPALWRRIDSSFTGVLPAPAATLVEPTAARVLDVDGDGDNDFIIAGRKGPPALTLWRYNAGRWAPEVIEPDSLRIEAGGASHDIDGDGDLDVAFGGDHSNGYIWWWENPHPKTGRWARHVIKSDKPTKHHDMIFGDFDGDGRAELVAWNQNGRQLIRFIIPNNPKSTTPWPFTTLFRWEGAAQHEGLAAIDVDGDGVTDIVGAGRWFRHAGEGRFTEEIVDPAMTFTRAVAGQFVTGGRPELVFGPGDDDGPLKWYQWENGRWSAHTLEPHMIHSHTLEAGDLNGDGHLDIMTAEMGQWSIDGGNNEHARVLAFYGDGKGDFRKQTVCVGQGVHEGRLADLNGDGRLDILSKPFRHHVPRLTIWLNQGTHSTPLSLDRWKRHLVDAPLTPFDSPLPPPQRARRLLIDAADIDGDGLPDLITGPAWHRNPGRLGATWERHDVGGAFGNFAIAYDFDGDGDIDLLGTTGPFKGAQLILAINDGTGHFTLRTDLPAGSGDFLQGAVAARLRGRQTSVILSWHRGEQIDMLSFPTGQSASPWKLAALSEESLNEQLTVGDIDGDADLDILLGTQWLRNDNDSWSQHRLGTVGDFGPKVKADRSRLADINHDGRLDAVVGLENGTGIFWFEQPEGDPSKSWTRHLVGDVAGQGFSLDVADFDADGDLDIVVGEHRNPDNVNRVILFENLDGAGGSWKQRVIDSGPANQIDHHDGTLAVDLDGDGDLDIASIGWNNSAVWVLENLAISSR